MRRRPPSAIRTLYLERLLERPRHVEVQVFGDRHGGAVHLFERDCSVQRRHQKIVEESPSPGLGDLLRRQMGEAAVALVRRIGYTNAGTIEFLVEGHGDAARFYFLEMNTRLQVEHPVTEMVAGVDLVHAQLRVASGEPLPWSQAQLSQRGHAIECRVYAEDPANDFLPQAGPLTLYREPRGPGIRVDSGVTEGGEIGIDYDPMIAKLIAWSETREAARRRVVAALRRYPILGIRTNIPFLIGVLEHPAFTEGSLDTAFLDNEGRELSAAVRRDRACPRRSPPPPPTTASRPAPADSRRTRRLRSVGNPEGMARVRTGTFTVRLGDQSHRVTVGPARRDPGGSRGPRFGWSPTAPGSTGWTKAASCAGCSSRAPATGGRCSWTARCTTWPPAPKRRRAGAAAGRWQTCWRRRCPPA